MSVRFGQCKCGAQTVTVTTPDRKRRVLDRGPNDDGDVIAYQQPDGRWTVEQVRPDLVGVRMRRHDCTQSRPERNQP